ncbi:hypothetical protein PN466_14920 [Roseofilum reptotaenium CS-1145]|nr:hypothetical protein [Roseofilum reptotaenium]MDB9518239.1 hypothetical protein [Roseofilum reptotaenium CS-1145]
MEATPGFGRDEKGNKVWNYSRICRMVRIDKKDLRPNGKPEKFCFPQFCEQKGKGDIDWGPYNFESVLFPTPEDKGKLLLMVEGEQCTDTAAKLGIKALTVQASEWRVETVSPWLKELADLGYAGFVLIPDNDVAGGKKMDIIQQACQIVGLHSVRLGMKTLWADCPEAGDITDWYEAGLASPEILEKAVEDVWRMPIEPPVEENK